MDNYLNRRAFLATMVGTAITIGAAPALGLRLPQLRPIAGFIIHSYGLHEDGYRIHYLPKRALSLRPVEFEHYERSVLVPKSEVETDRYFGGDVVIRYPGQKWRKALYSDMEVPWQ
jgi:hypothetical protein